MQSITTKQVHVDDAAYQQVYDIREAVLRRPIGLSLKDEDLTADKDDIIIAAQSGDVLIGCLMLHPVGSDDYIKFRQMAVVDAWQGKGIGNLLMQAGEELAWDKGYNKIVLHARVSAQGFYEKMGYTTTSGVFKEVGIPHVVMEKQKS